jgi:predicted Rossmann fold nucleotide-binding protein DprA/Smf involved in DNA uptake
MKLAIAGYRGFSDYERFKRELVLFIEEYGKPLEIISGGAVGTDTLA